MGRVRYGIKNAYYAIATDNGSGELTYATPISIPGAKSISLEPQGEAVDEYADNLTWWHGTTNNGYSGSIEFEDTADLEDFLVAVLGWTEDSSTGVITETASDEPSEFALAFQFEMAGGDENGKRVWLLRCTASRPSLAGQTKEGSITVQTNTINITAMPRVADDAVKTTCVSSDSAYSTWFSTVVE